jgi:tetratricopeptide (TPR) repeat protein
MTTEKGKVDAYQIKLKYDSLLTEGLKQRVLGNYDQSKELFTKCVSLKPRNAAPYYELSIVDISTGKISDALSAALKAACYEKKNEWYLLQVSKIYQFIGNIDSSLYYYKKIVKARPDKPDYKLKLAKLYFDNNGFKKSLKILKRLENEEGLSNDIFLLRYKDYLALNDNKKGIQTLKQAIKKYPYESRFYGIMAEHYGSTGDSKHALIYYKILLRMEPNSEKAYMSLIDFYLNSKQYNEAFYFIRKFVLNADFKLENKIEILSTSLDDQNNFNLYLAVTKALIDSVCSMYNENVKVHLLLSKYYLKINDLNAAQSELEKCLNLSKNDEGVWEELLLVFDYKKDYQSLYEYCNSGISYFPENPVLFLYKGMSCFYLNKFSEAIDALSYGLKYTKNSQSLLVKYYAYLGECFNKMGNYIKSDLFFESSLARDPNNPEVLNNYSFYLSQRNEKLDRALIYMERCVRLEPKNWLFLDTYALVLYKSRKFSKAKKFVEEALSQRGDNQPVILEHYCEILIALHKKEDALKYYNKLKEQGIVNSKIEDILNEMK